MQLTACVRCIDCGWAHRTGTLGRHRMHDDPPVLTDCADPLHAEAAQVRQLFCWKLTKGVGGAAGAKVRAASLFVAFSRLVHLASG